MDLNKKRKLLTEITSIAPKLAKKSEAELNLIEILSAFDQVLSDHKIDAESSEALDLYKTLLRLGRITTKTWEARIQENLDVSCNISNLDISKEKITSEHPELDNSSGHKVIKQTISERAEKDLRIPLYTLSNRGNSRYSALEELKEDQPSAISLPQPNTIELPKLNITRFLGSNAANTSLDIIHKFKEPMVFAYPKKERAEREITEDIQESVIIADSFQVH